MSSLKSRKRTERITNALCFIALIFLTCLCMLPIWWIFRSSLMSNAELFKWPPAFFPPRWLFSNYANTLEYFKFWTYLKNTMIIIVPSVIFGTITATMCGYAFARLRAAVVIGLIGSQQHNARRAEQREQEAHGQYDGCGDPRREVILQLFHFVVPPFCIPCPTRP